MAVGTGNPFYIEPAKANIQPLLAGIGSMIEDSRAEALKKANSEKLMAAYQSGNIDDVSALIAENPELGKTALDMLNFKNDATAKNFTDTVRSLVQTDDVEKQKEILINRINKVNEENGNPVQSVLGLNQLEQGDIKGFNDSLLGLAATALSPQEYDAYKLRTGTGAPADYSMAKSFAMGAEPDIVNGVNVNEGKMIRAIPTGDDKGYKTFGTPYYPRNTMFDTGTGYVNRYNNEETIRKNLEQASAETQKGKSKVIDWFKENQDLRETEGGRVAGLKKARKFYTAIKEGKMSSGGMRAILSVLPFTFTEQGQMDEEFNAFSETAARQALKDSGEIRPTDADVKGMKQAMFGIGRDEKVNMNLLQDFIDSIERGNHKKYLLDLAKAYKSGKPQPSATNENQAVSQEQQISLPAGITEEDITETMSANGMTREQVLEAINNGRP